MLRCKFKLMEVTTDAYGRRVKLSATNSKAGDNQDWSKYTPSGELTLCVTNEAAFKNIDEMQPGTMFWIDIRPVAEET